MSEAGDPRARCIRAARSSFICRADARPGEFRLLRSIELPLFRILQACLSNVHRHAESQSVDVRFAINDKEARLEVKDYGKGIDPELLRQFDRSGGGSGIGLAGMRERVRELGGRSEVESDQKGTLIRAVVPVSTSREGRKSGTANRGG